MKISIITPTLNQSNFIEKTIQSVQHQNYSNFEHIIIDGESTDSTIDILKKYDHLIWISEKDTGQSNAINKGFNIATGDIICWLNSDDYFAEDTLNIVSDYFQSHPDSMILYGDITYINEKDEVLREITGDKLSYQTLLMFPDYVRQPSTFWRKIILDEVGSLDESLQLVMDLDFFLRISRKYKFNYKNQNLSYFRAYGEGKTFRYQRRQVMEIIKVLHRFIDRIDNITKKILLKRFLLTFALFRFLLNKKK